ncbi:MAG: DUF6483 family protein [Finegoldia sp.]|nr:DUF6483 family protein [Finegoldia sp.]
MIESKDWLLSQINVLVKFLAGIFANKKISEDMEEDSIYKQDSFNFERLLESLIAEGRINEAEDLLFDRLENLNYIDANLAVRFYEKLNLLPDEKLEEADYSREEILQGLRDLSKLFGLNFS